MSAGLHFSVRKKRGFSVGEALVFVRSVGGGQAGMTVIAPPTMPIELWGRMPAELQARADAMAGGSSHNGDSSSDVGFLRHLQTQLDKAVKRGLIEKIEATPALEALNRAMNQARKR